MTFNYKLFAVSIIILTIVIFSILSLYNIIYKNKNEKFFDSEDDSIENNSLKYDKNKYSKFKKKKISDLFRHHHYY